MAFAQMVVSDEDSIICDFAQYYHVLDWRSIPIRTASILACGLPPESRSMRRITGSENKTDTLLLGLIVDSIRMLHWSFSNRKSQKPESVVERLLSSSHASAESENMSFDDASDFERFRESILENSR